MRYGGTWTPADRAESAHRAVPFDVPPGCDGIAVTLSYDRSAGVLDLGCAGPAGFRSASRDGPLLLRVGDELLALGAEGLLITDPSGRRRPVPGERARFAAAPGPHWLEDGRTTVLAVTA